MNIEALNAFEDEIKSMPPGDARAERMRMAQRLRDLICELQDYKGTHKQRKVRKIDELENLLFNTP